MFRNAAVCADVLHCNLFLYVEPAGAAAGGAGQVVWSAMHPRTVTTGARAAGSPCRGLCRVMLACLPEGLCELHLVLGTGVHVPDNMCWIGLYLQDSRSTAVLLGLKWGSFFSQSD